MESLTKLTFKSSIRLEKIKYGYDYDMKKLEYMEQTINSHFFVIDEKLCLLLLIALKSTHYVIFQFDI